MTYIIKIGKNKMKFVRKKAITRFEILVLSSKTKNLTDINIKKAIRKNFEIIIPIVILRN